ncbi:MAG: hypothetical protein ACRDRZ_13255 [Pseudonocardiaceae bacterium]
MCAVAPLTISGWHTVIATVLIVLLTVGYGELRARDTPHRPPDTTTRRKEHYGRIGSVRSS